MKLPKGYKEIDVDEMMYLDGGYRATRPVYVKAGSKRMSVDAYVQQYNNGNALLGFVGTSVASVINPGIGFLLGAIGFIWSTFSPGKSAATRLDRADGKVDGMLTIRWGGFYKYESNPYPPNSYEGARF